MNHREWDENITQPISDVLYHNNKTAVACYDKSVRFYSGNILVSAFTLPTPVTKMYSYYQYIIATSMSAGLLYIIDNEHRVVDVIDGLHEPNLLVMASKGFLVSCLGACLQYFQEVKGANSLEDGAFKELYTMDDICMLAENPHLFQQVKTIETSKVVTCGISNSSEILIAYESLLVAYNQELEETFSKDFCSCINSIVFFDSGILVGLLNGKIYCENLQESDESFVFNSHYDILPEKKVLFPVTQLVFDQFLFSSGAEGKIYKWNLKNKRKVSTLFSNQNYVRKFVFSNNKLLILVDDLIKNEGSSKLLCVNI